MVQTIVAFVSNISPNGLPNQSTGAAGASVLQTILSVVFAIAASISLLVIVVAGFRYIVARGDSSAVAQARNAIFYAIIGLLVSMAAFSIVTFVIKGVA